MQKSYYFSAHLLYTVKNVGIRHAFFLILLGLSILFPGQKSIAQSACNCEYYMYLNDVQGSGSGNGFVHKFRINSNGTFTEIFSNPPTNTIPWFPTGGGLPSPHGLAQDLNGNIYIGEGPFGFGTDDIRKLSCSGTLVPGTTFKIDDGGYNFASRNGIVYVNSAAASNRINAYNICDGSLIGWITLAGVKNVNGAPQNDPGTPANEDWGFSIAPDGTFYATSGIGDYSGNGKTDRIFRFTPTLADFTAHTNYTAFITSASYPAGITDNEHETFGITSDPAGNMYVVVSDFNTTRRWILKFNSSGVLVDSNSELASTPTGGFEGARGIAYHEPTNKVYVAGGVDGDCVAIINPATLNYEGAALAHVPGQFPKGLAIVKECCPATSPVTISKSTCIYTVGQKYFLADLTGSCDAPLCAGGNAWVPGVANSSNLVFNACDNSVTVVGEGCGTFTLTNPGVGNACGAFTFTVDLCFNFPPTATFTQSPATCTPGGNPNNNGTITFATATGVTNFGISTAGAATYNGPAYPATTFTAVGQNVSTTIPNTGGTYIVRVFNGAADCFTDVTVTVAPVPCGGIQSCNCTEYIYLNEPEEKTVLKFKVGGGVPLTMINAPGGGAWYPGSNVSELPFPHGIATDLNGNLYIGAGATNGYIRKLTCDGDIFPVTATTVFDAGVHTNMFSIGNTLYVTGQGGPSAYDLCTGAKIGQMCLAGEDGNQINGTPWGLSYNPVTETVYVSGLTRNRVWAFSRAQLEAGIAGTGTCILPLIVQGTNATVNIGENFTPNDDTGVLGIVGDNAGNIYVIESATVGGTGTYILKYNASGFLLAKSAVDNVLGGGGYYFGMGIVWSEGSNRLYVSNRTGDPTEDCIAAFDANTMAYLGAAAPNPLTGAGSGSGKAIGIVKECCPVNLPMAFTKNVCGGVGDKFYLNEEAFNTCDGIVCGSSWTPTSINGMTFDACDNSVTITGVGCSTFSLNISAVSSTGCGAQSATFTICNSAPPVVIASAGPCNPATNEYTVTGQVNMSNPPASGSMTVSVSGGGSQVFNAPFAGTSPFTITGLNSGGATRTVTVKFSDAASCGASTTYNEPIACTAQRFCNCTEYIYLNEPAIGAVLKFEVGTGVPLTEVAGVNGPGHWYPGSGASVLPSPHGLGTDLNGRLYIGSSYLPNEPVRRFNCDGQIEPVGPATINNQFILTNMFSIDNTIYATRSGGPAAYNSCTGALIGTMCLNDQNGNQLPNINSTSGTDLNWGLSYNSTTQKVYITGVSSPRRSVWVLTKNQLEAGIAGGPCISPLIPLGTTSVLNPGDNFLPNNIEDLRGVVSDNAGNIYVAGWYADLSGFVLKYNAAGQFIAATTLSPKYKLSIGIIWSEATNRIYVSNGTDDPAVDCISAFDAVSMVYVGTAAPNPNLPDNNAGKALAIIKECCPVNLPAAFTTNVCGAVGQKFYLNQEAFNTCDGIVCGSTWTPVLPLTGMTFDPCDNSVTITVAGSACGTFILNLGSVGGTGCAAQTSTVTICNNPTLQSIPTISGCYQNGGSKATVSMEVSWSNLGVSSTVNDNSDRITVTFGGQTKYINPGPYTSTGGNGTIVSPQVVAFEVNADGSSQTAQVFIGNDYASASCKIQQTGIPLPDPCPSTVCASGQTGGTVFNDYNADGIQQSGETAGLLGITVSAYDCNGNLVGTTNTDVDGNYVFTSIPPGAYPIRVEFSGLPTLYSQGTPNGSDGRTTVQFVSTADCDIDLGVLNPQDYCQVNPKIVLPCYVVGDPQHPGSATDGALVGVNYDLTGGNSYFATIPQLGTVWGTAYKKSNNMVYSAAFVKRHSGLGPDGLGAIYQTNIGSNTTSLLANVTALGVNLGTISSNTTRGLGAKTAPNADPEAFAKAGKVGMGDIDISEDGSTLYFVNLFERKLHSLNIASPTTAPGVNIPNPGCNGGEFRPWGLKVYQGKVYVGVVCDAGTSQSKSNLRAYVYAYDITSGTFNTTPVFDFPLTYPKGFAVTPSGVDKTGWYPWTDDFPTLLANGFVGADPVIGGAIFYPTPVFSDIEFDIDGSMVLGFMDRIGLQLGAQQLGVNGTGLYSIVVGGDILRAYSKGGTFVLENNGKAGPASGYGPDNNQGPGVGEFYNDDFLYFGSLAHSENSQGALAIRPGSGETVYTAMDPVTDVANSGGVRKGSNTTGLVTGAYTIVSGFGANGLYDKAQSLGDIELSCAPPTYLQIGNYVWIDTDKDGVQDPCESPLPGVSVSLYKIVAGTPTLVAVTTTGANGEYYFTNNTLAGETWLNSATGLLPNMDYKIVFGYNGQTSTAQYTANNLLIGGNNYILTALNVGEGANIDLNDSDASLMAIAGASYPSINVTTGAVGTVNHTYDAGFWFCQDISSPSAAQSICEGNTGNDITVQTTSNAAGSIRFVRFTTDQMAGAVPSAAEALAIYSGATVGAAVNPTGIANPYTATLTTSAAGWSTQAPATYYVYAILNTDQGASCRPVQEIIVTITSQPNLAVTNGSICANSSIDLALLVTNAGGGTLSFYTTLADAQAGTNSLASSNVSPTGMKTYYVRSEATATCFATGEITVSIASSPGLMVTTGSVCSGGSIDLNTLVTNAGGGSLTFHSTYANAVAGNPIISSIVSPSAATNYYVRSTFSSGCFGVREISVTLKLVACGVITLTGPTN